MTKNRQLQRLAIALLASILWNCVLIATPFFTVRFPSSRIGRVMDALGRPGGAFAEWLLPGHDAPQVVLIITSSVVFYAVLMWVTLSLPVWWRSRQ